MVHSIETGVNLKPSFCLAVSSVVGGCGRTGYCQVFHGNNEVYLLYVSCKTPKNSRWFALLNPQRRITAVSNILKRWLFWLLANHHWTMKKEKDSITNTVICCSVQWFVSLALFYAGRTNRFFSTRSREEENCHWAFFSVQLRCCCSSRDEFLCWYR